MSGNIDKTRQRGCSLLVALYALAALGIAMLLCGCTRTVYKPVETVRTEYVEADTTGLYERMRGFFESQRLKETSSDSLIDRTKETVVLKENGDTARHDKERIVYVASHREKELEHKVQQQDSTIKALRLQLESVKSDTIPVPYPVERDLSRWEQAKQDVGGLAIGAIIAVVCIAVVWLIRKFRK
ncbi:hypothetical protein [Paramuribaculum intestinale]|uniref:hypothetical protein n=1 Tax=Paramuribaculum intestinale TaxID=2094151 RepID=UPI0025AA0A3E|nr:hypothetical protein [Paramuribaculum intestinale]